MFGSSATIERALSTSSSAPSNVLINVPQKCYAFITPDTPQNVKGLYTLGLSVCSGIGLYAHDTTGRYLFLCHADPQTDLTDNVHGILGWIRNIPPEINPIVIEFDNVEEYAYEAAIDYIIANNNTEHTINIIPKDPDATGMLMLRTGEIIREGYPHYDYQDYSTLESDIDQYLENMIEFAGETKYPPVCIFDGIHLLDAEEISVRLTWVLDAINHSVDVDSDEQLSQNLADTTHAPSLKG